MTSKAEGSPSMRMFGSVVRSLREARDIIAEDLATETGYSKSMTIKIERGDRMPPPLFVERAEAMFNSGDVLTKAAQHLERSSFPFWFEPYVDLEKQAISLYTFDTVVINGLLQTEEYARVVLNARCPVMEADEVEQRVEARMARQELLSRTPAAHTAFVIEEWVLRRKVGGREVHQRQLARLLEIGARRNVMFQIMPMAQETHAGLDGPMHLLETPDRNQYAYVEGQGQSLLLGDREEVSTLNQRYAMIRSQALSHGESAKMIESIAGEL